MAITKSYNGFPGKYRESQGRKQSNLFKTGAVKRPTQCKACGITTGEGGTIHSHSEDYSNIYEVHGVCFCCHMAIHKRFQDLKTWAKWADLVSEGWQPPVTRDYDFFMQTWHGLRSETVDTPSKLNWLHSLPLEEPNLYNPTDGQLFDA